MMSNGNRVRRASTLKVDVCIVGAGAAGITVAQALSGSKLRVILLESGGLVPDGETQQLYRGRITGNGQQPPLDASRLRYFGGTTNVWSGWCGPLDEFDFAARDWVPGSGWPIGLETLEAYYPRAHEVCDLGPWDYGEGAWGAFAKPIPGIDDLGARLTLIQQSKPTHFGEKYGEELSSSGNVHVLLDSNLLELVPDPAVRTIEQANVGTLAGNRFSIASRVFIIACGAIENARLLLASDRVAEKGIGNDRDLVGRYFLDHTRVRPAGAVIWESERASKLAQYTVVDGVRATLALGLGLDVQRRSGLTNSQFFAEGSRAVDDLPGDLQVPRFLHGLQGQDADTTASKWWLRCEQSPNPDSRVTLSTHPGARSPHARECEPHLRGGPHPGWRCARPAAGPVAGGLRGPVRGGDRGLASDGNDAHGRRARARRGGFGLPGVRSRQSVRRGSLGVSDLGCHQPDAHAGGAGAAPR
jgi:hypothetical protein